MTVTSPGGISQAAADARYSPQPPGLVAPVANPSVFQSTVETTPAANRLYLVRAIVPRSGTLHDLAVWVGATAAANIIGAIYDTGDASPGNRTKLWDSGSVAVTASSNVWQVIGDPNLAVVAEQQLELALICSAATPAFGRGTASARPQALALPANFMPAAGGASPKLAASLLPGSFSVPLTIAEATAVVDANAIPYALMARVA